MLVHITKECPSRLPPSVALPLSSTTCPSTALTNTTFCRTLVVHWLVVFPGMLQRDAFTAFLITGYDAITDTHRHTDTQTHRHTDTQTHRHTDTQTQTQTQTEREMHTISPSLSSFPLSFSLLHGCITRFNVPPIHGCSFVLFAVHTADLRIQWSNQRRFFKRKTPKL